MCELNHIRMAQAERVLVMRTCAADMSSSHGFVWPESGHVECSDWSPKPTCGHGLHGLLWGAGDGSLLDWSPNAKWLVVAVDAASIVDLEGKVKFPCGEVVHCGDRLSATAFISNDPHAVCVVGGTATAGNCGTATAGNYGTATAGDDGTATAGNYGTATAGNYGTATAGDDGTATAGNFGTATAGNCGTATAGNYGTATAGDDGTATAGDDGTATAGNCGTATAGNRGELRIRWYDGETNRYRTAIAYVGENGIEADAAYRLDDEHQFVKVTP